MTTVLVAAMLVVLGLQLWQVVRHRRGGPGRHPGASAWHAVMAAVMAAMLAVTLPPLAAAAGAVLFAAGALWAGGVAWHVRDPGSGLRALHARLAVACGAMVVMLWSGAASAASSAPPRQPVAGAHHAPEVVVAHAHGDLLASPTGAVVTALALAAALVVALVSARRAVLPQRRGALGQTRTDACCETYSALVAAGMLAAPLLAVSA